MRTVQRWLEEQGVLGQSSPRVGVIRQYTSQSPASGRSGTRIMINRVPRPYWEERGWQHENGNYFGHFQTRFGSWPGCVTVSPGGRVEVFIQNPPAVLSRHPHWQCFQKRKDGWYFVHPTNGVQDASAGILSIEKTITEAYEI